MKIFLFLAVLFVPMTILSQTIPQPSAAVPPIEPGVSHELAKWRAAHYSDVRYRLNLTLEKMSPVLKGTMEIRVGVRTLLSASAQGADIPPIVLDWREIKGHENLSNISNVTLNGVAVSSPSGDADRSVRTPFEERDEHLIFRQGVKLGENVIKLDFTSPILTSGSAITRYIDKEDGAEYIYSLFVPSDASTAFPVFDQPDLKARFTVVATTPGDWKFITNERSLAWLGKDITYFPGPKPPYGDGMGRIAPDFLTNGFHVKETKPISTYVFAFAAGPFEGLSEPPAVAGGLTRSTTNTAQAKSVSSATTNDNLQPPATAGGSDLATSIYVRKSQAGKFKPHAAEVFRLNREGVKFLEQYFDYKFPFPKYDIVLIPEFPFGGMEHAGATFLREDRVIFPQEPTANDYITRANVIFHEAAHQWFGDTVTMKWFDDLWLKEGFAEFMAYKTLEKVMPQYNAWKVFYERNKQAAYLTDSTKGTTPIYQEIANLSAAKSAYGNIVYRKAPSFLRMSEYLFGEDKFQKAVRTFLKKHEFANAEWTDLVKELEGVSGYQLQDWARAWVTQRGAPIIRVEKDAISQRDPIGTGSRWVEQIKLYTFEKNINPKNKDFISTQPILLNQLNQRVNLSPTATFVFPNYQDYGYGIFLLDDKSRDYVLKNIQNEKDDFLRTMMWGSLWDSVREGELDPREFVELVVKNLRSEPDESTTALLLNRVGTAMNYYLSEPDAKSPVAIAPGSDLRARVEDLLIEQMQNSETLGQRITYYRAFLNVSSSNKARTVLKDVLNLKFEIKFLKLKTKDKFDIVTRLMILGDPEAPKLLAELEKAETSDEAKRYAYAAKAGIATAENKARYWNDFVNNKEISESWIEAAFGPWNSIRHSELTLPYLQKALQELPNLKRNRKIFFINGWLGAFIGGQGSEEALAIVNKFLADNPTLDKDLRLKILENVDVIERAVKIRAKNKN